MGPGHPAGPVAVPRHEHLPALLVGAALAPTDAALGSSMMVRTWRRPGPDPLLLLNIESGLNDGIATPVVLVAIAGAATAEHAASVGPGQAAAELALPGVLVGGQWRRGRICRARHAATGPRAVSPASAVLALALCAYARALAVHGNGFIAAFVGGGLAYGAAAGMGERGERLMPYVEETGALVSLLAWLAFGAIAVVPAFENSDVAGAVRRSQPGLHPDGTGGAGAGVRNGSAAWPLPSWAGLGRAAWPRWPALLALEDIGKSAEPAVTVIVFTILLSVIAHGLSADPLAHHGPRLASTIGEPGDAGMLAPARAQAHPACLTTQPCAAAEVRPRQPLSDLLGARTASVAMSLTRSTVGRRHRPVITASCAADTSSRGPLVHQAGRQAEPVAHEIPEIQRRARGRGAHAEQTDAAMYSGMAGTLSTGSSGVPIAPEITMRAPLARAGEVAIEHARRRDVVYRGIRTLALRRPASPAEVLALGVEHGDAEAGRDGPDPAGEPDDAGAEAPRQGRQHRGERPVAPPVMSTAPPSVTAACSWVRRRGTGRGQRRRLGQADPAGEGVQVAATRAG